MSNYDTSTIKTFDNEVVEVKLENQLITKANMAMFFTPDYSLTENAGMKKKVRTYTGNGDVEELGMGEGNTTEMGASFKEVEYEVGTTQGKGSYFDEQAMNDPTVIDKLVQFMGEQMTNDDTKKAIAEMGKTPQKIYGAIRGFDVVSDAVASFPNESTENEQLFLLIARKDSSAWRKALKDDLKYVESFVRTGYIGSVCSVPMYWNDAVPTGRAFLGTKEAVTKFIKKGVEVEPNRIPNIRKNEIFTRKVQLFALTNGNKMIEITTNADPRTGYTIVENAPSNWASTFTNYYSYDHINEVMVKLTGDVAPEFVANTYFSKD